MVNRNQRAPYPRELIQATPMLHAEHTVCSWSRGARVPTTRCRAVRPDKVTGRALSLATAGNHDREVSGYPPELSLNVWATGRRALPV